MDAHDRNSTSRISSGFFRALTYLYRTRAEILRSDKPMTKGQRELMAKLFDSLADNAAHVEKVLRKLKEAELPK